MRKYVFLLAVVLPLSAQAAELFPRPLHIVRTLEDSLAAGPVTVDQYCSGNRIVSVSGTRVVITDYATQQVTEIDRAALTYSITPFEKIAAVRSRRPSRAAEKSAPFESRWKQTALPSRQSSGGRTLDVVEFVREARGEKQRHEIGVDRQFAISPAALDALIGAAYPNEPADEHEVIARIVRMSASSESVAMPVEQRSDYTIDGATVTVRSAIQSIRHEEPPAELMMIPPGARLIESPLIRTARELEELDRIPTLQPR